MRIMIICAVVLLSGCEIPAVSYVKVLNIEVESCEKEFNDTCRVAVIPDRFPIHQLINEHYLEDRALLKALEDKR